MKKHYYKKYYETHKEQEKARTLAYYHKHKIEILAKKKANYRNKPKVYKPTLREQLAITERALYLAVEQISEFQYGCEEFNVCQICSNWYTDAENCAEIECKKGYVNYFLNKAKEILKDEVVAH